MPTSNHTINGTVAAIQYTGTNAAEIATALGTPWATYVSPQTALLCVNQIGSEMFSQFIPSGDWLVSVPAYGANTPALANGFSVLSNAQFTQQYA